MTIRRSAKRELRLEKLEDRMLLAVGPQLIGINPNEGELLLDGALRDIAPRQLTFKFDEGQIIDSTTLDGIQITRSGLDGSFSENNEVPIVPGFIGVDPNRSEEVIVRFSESLPDDVYRIDILGAGNNALTNVVGDPFNDGEDQRIQFELDLGAQIISVVPQPVSRDGITGELSQARNQIIVHFNDDDLDEQVAKNPEFYQLILTSDSATNTDDVVYSPSDVQYDVDADTAILTFDELESEVDTYRLRIGSNESLPRPPRSISVNSDPGSSFDTANDDIGVLGSQSIILSSAIEPQNFILDFPGAIDEPGHRDTRVETHLNQDADSVPGITEQFYNFKDVYGMDPSGNPLHNLITETQKQRAREVFELYSNYLGIQFKESASKGFTIVTGDMRALDPTVPTGSGGVAGLTAGTTSIMDNAEDWDDSFGGNWFQTAMHEIGHLLGLGHSFDLPPISIQGDDLVLNFNNVPEPIFPGDHDIVHGQHLLRPESADIDLYQFEIQQTGLLSAETFAERQEDSSLLDTVLTLYKMQSDGGHELIARNDDYYSEDSLLRMELGPGIYVIGISASGNDKFDPTIEDSGFGGRSQGLYDLRLRFREEVNSTIVDATGTALDGDANGVPGGVYNFWFRSQTPDRTLFVDKSSDSEDRDGSLSQPYNLISEAFAAAQPGDIVRIVGNPGEDGIISDPEDNSVLEDNLAYEIGFDSLNQPLSDGTSGDVPQGVSVMIDAGAIFKMRRATFQVGSSSPAIDRSAGSLQILGTPESSVIFTSFDDELVGFDTSPLAQTPDSGDWAGLVFRNDLDRAANLFDYEEQGIFLNYVNHADIRYGGGNVVIDSLQQSITPIHMTDARPTITHNIISLSSGGAMSANPNSFEETNFHDSRFQSISYTSDYDRIGPEIHGNRLSDNTVNGLFVRIKTAAGNVQQPLTVSGRWDDTDIVHVVSENLVIKGTPGGPIEDPGTGLLTARQDARLSIDPGVIVKLDGARFQTGIGSQLIAEGVDGHEVVFTSLLDDRYGAGGTFDTSNDLDSNLPAEGDWAGIFLGHASSGSIDHSFIAYGGGVTKVEGSFTGFNVIEIHQAQTRITNSTFENNADGTGGQALPNRVGRGFNAPGTIFVRGAQPVIADNIFRNNIPVAININANSLNHHIVSDSGRSTGPIDQIFSYADNQGPLIRENLIADTSLNGMVVRGATLTTQGVWDDTDITHIVFDTMVVPNFHTFGGLRLESSPTESLVVKLEGEEAGFTATGTPLEIDDRIGGAIQVVGQPGFPVVLTSINDCSVGAGFTPDGQPQVGICDDSALSGTEIFAPMIDQFTDSNPNIDEWNLIADSSGTITVEVYDDADGTIDIDGIMPTATVPGGFTTLTLTGVAPGSTHVFTHALGGGETLTHYRPEFQGVDQVYLVENRTSPNDLFNNSMGGNGGEIGSNLELGFDERFDILPSRFADTTWFYDLDVGDTITWRGFFDDFPGGVDAVQLELFDANGVQQALATTPPFLAGAGTTFVDTVQAGQEGFWSVKLTAPDIVFPFAGHYLMDVEVTDAAGDTVPDKSERHYLLPGSLLDPADFFGDWRSIRFEQYSSDRNIEVITELEPPDISAPGENATPGTAELLGALAPSEKAGDDIRRLGFEVHGFLPEPSDVDVYSFTADAGTEVWFDIDRTSSALDTVVELIDANAKTIARSDNSTAELGGLESLFMSPGVEARPMQKSAFLGEDHWTTNPLDAGMRVILPGSQGTTNTYHVRVRSSSENLDSDLLGGLTSGVYQLQIRLRETDEIPGSSVQFADIRFATNGIEIIGPPIHSPLSGEAVEDTAPNGDLVINAIGANLDPFLPRFSPRHIFFPNIPPDFSDPQRIGNVLISDRGALTVAGNLDNTSDVDWYQFEVTHDSVLDIPGLTDAPKTVPLTFDLDYADGLARANTVLSVYRAFTDDLGSPFATELLFSSTDSNIADDQPAPLNGADIDDLSRGTVGALDPFLGPVALTEGTYLVSITSNEVVPTEFEQFIIRGPTQPLVPFNPLVRLEPNPEIKRVAEDHILDPTFATVDPPQVEVLLDASSAVPFHLGDVVLFVSQDSGTEETGLFTVDPFTGAQETFVGTLLDVDGNSRDIGDIALRLDTDLGYSGDLFGLSIDLERNDPDAPTDEFSGNLLQINTGDATYVTLENNNIITTFECDDPTDLLNCGPTGSDVGIQFNATAFFPPVPSDEPRLFAVGNRGDQDLDPPPPGVERLRNFIYELNPTSGEPIPLGQDRFTGAGTNAEELGEILTHTIAVPDMPEPLDVYTFDVTDELGNPTGNPVMYMDPGMDDPNGMMIPDPADPTGMTMIPLQVASPIDVIIQGLLDAWNGATDPAFGLFTAEHQGNRLALIANDPANPARVIGTESIIEGFGPGGIVTGLAVIGSNFYAVSDVGGLWQVLGVPGDPDGASAQYIPTSAEDLLGFEFSGLTHGPADVEGGIYTEMLFGISGGGDLNAFNVEGSLQPIFLDGATSVPTNISNAHGVEFSNLTENLWHTTDARGGDPGHGGGFSYYFGFEDPTLGPLGYDFAGGAHGTIVSNEFSLAEAAKSDQPVLYFNYYIDGEDSALDAFRAFIADESGEWNLLGTNTPGDAFADPNPTDDIAINVQELFDNPPLPIDPNNPPAPDDPPDPNNDHTWRQVRVDLSDYAGHGNLKLRFDFATAGAMNLGDIFTTGTELRGIAASDLRDEDIFSVDGQIFEFDLGYTAIVPTGAAISDGETLTLEDAQGAVATFEFDSDNSVTPGNISVLLSPAQTSAEVVQFLIDAITMNGPAGVIPHANGPRLNLEGAVNLTQSPGAAISIEGAPGIVTDDALPVLVHSELTSTEVAEVLDAVLTPLFVGFSQQIVTVDGSQITDGELFSIDDGRGPVLFEFDSGFTAIIPAPDANGRGGMVDGGTLLIENTASGNSVTFEFDDDGNIAAGNSPIPFTDPADIDSIGNTLAASISISSLGLSPIYLGGGILHLGGTADHVVTDSSRMTVSGAPGTQARVPTELVSYAPSVSFDATLVADAIVNAISNPVSTAVGINVTASSVPGAVNLIGGNIVFDPVDTLLTSVGAPDTAVKSYKDLVNIIGHSIDNPGPLGSAIVLAGGAGDFKTSDPAVRAQNNDFEGIYLDDIVIGFAERGEQVSNADNNRGFIPNPNAGAGEIIVGEYQLEIRQAADFITIPKTFDTNDRPSDTFTLTAPSGSDIASGQTFLIGDSHDTVTFELRDSSSTSMVGPGNIAIDFSSSDTSAQLANRIRDAINSPEVQAILDVTASSALNSPRVDLFGGFTNLGRPVEVREANDTLADARDTGLLGGRPGVFVGEGMIGDNANVAPAAGLDVDLFRLELNAGDSLKVDIDAAENQSLLDSMLRLFDAAGNELALSNDDPAPGEIANTDSYLEYTTLESGIFFVGVSGLANAGYDPLTEGSGSPGLTGEYDIEIFVGGQVGRLKFTENGDHSRFRDQGQILIESNRISNSSGYGIVVEDSLRDLPTYDFFDAQPHTQFVEGDYTPYGAPVRNLREINTERLVPGLTITNNVISNGGEGGIHFSGDPNGFVIVAPIGGSAGEVFPNAPNLPTAEVCDACLISAPQFTFSITDIPGTTVIFEFENANTNDGVQPGNVPVLFNPNPIFPRFAPGPDMTEALISAIASTNLKVNIFRGKGDEIFVEGATEVIGINPGTIPDWFSPFYFEAQKGAVPFARILNNTIYGNGDGSGDFGILVEENASPTLLNNIVANFETGIEIDNSSQTSVVGGNVYQSNGVNSSNVGLGDFAITLADNDPLFVDPANGNFYLTEGSPAIDSSVDTLEDRPDLITVSEPLGITVSPILAPDRDVTGQLRVDDPNVDTPSGQGENVFKDRGALDRADFVGPTALLTGPQDNDAEGNDRNPAETIVRLTAMPISEFSIQLGDGLEPSNPLDGVGVDDNSVVNTTVTITRLSDEDALIGAAPVLLVDGVDYTFQYDTTNNIIRLTSLAGIWPLGNTYVVTLDNASGGIRDRANNALRPNQLTDITQFTIVLAEVDFDFGDAPDPSYPTLFENNGASHVIVPNLFLGDGVDADLDGQPTSITPGDLDDGVTFGPLLLGDDSSIVVTASAEGLLDAWIDFNADGDWDDVGEQILVGRQLAAGRNEIDVAIPEDATTGVTYARFRLSSEGGLLPTGPAPDGEVEDYELAIFKQKPWQNEPNQFDVNNNSLVNSIDLLRLLRNINADGNRVLGLPEPGGPELFLDVNGDGFVSPLDILLLKNELDRLASIDPSEGQGEGESHGISGTIDVLAGRDVLARDEELDSVALEFSGMSMPSSVTVGLNSSESVEREFEATSLNPAYDASSVNLDLNQLLDQDLALMEIGEHDIATSEIDSALNELAEDISNMWENIADQEDINDWLI